MTDTVSTPRVDNRARRRRRLATTLTVLTVLVIGVVVVGAFALARSLSGPKDYTGEGSGSVQIQVTSGESATAIGQTLFDKGVVASVAAFANAALADPRSLGIQPGYYDMRRQMSGQAALERLLDPAARVQTDVTIPEGLRVDEIVARLAAASGVPLKDFVTALKNPKSLGLPSYAEGNPEGFLFPATYSFGPNATAVQMLRTMVKRFDQAAVDVNLVKGAKAANVSPRQAVIVASLVQAEVAERDFGKAARVIYNRLNVSMPLQFDSTVNFALKSNDLTLTNDQLGFDSPYNTYKYAGLPPGPINSPGEAALRAALKPPAGNWIYFVAVAPGSDQTRFTSDYNQFLKWKAQFYAAVGP